MDKVLTRKMFRDRYFKSPKPKYNVGGIYQNFGLGGISQREKAILAATFAAPLLQEEKEWYRTGVLCFR